MLISRGRPCLCSSSGTRDLAHEALHTTIATPPHYQRPRRQTAPGQPCTATASWCHGHLHPRLPPRDSRARITQPLARFRIPTKPGAPSPRGPAPQGRQRSALSHPPIRLVHPRTGSAIHARDTATNHDHPGRPPGPSASKSHQGILDDLDPSRRRHRAHAVR